MTGCPFLCVIFNSEAAVIHVEQHNVQQQLEAVFEARGGASCVSANAMLGVEEFSSALGPSKLTCSLAAQAGQDTPAPICQECNHTVPVVTDSQTAGITLRNAVPGGYCIPGLGY